jgi:hypothetical protein
MRATSTKTATVLLWVAQTLLAALFLYAGAMKFVMPVEAMTAQAPVALSGAFIHFIGVCEMLGALGLVLPGLTGVRRELTPIAAAGLVIVMIGATAISALMGVGAALVPAVVGALAATVARGRRDWLVPVPTLRPTTLHAAR